MENLGDCRVNTRPPWIGTSRRRSSCCSGTGFLDPWTADFSNSPNWEFYKAQLGGAFPTPRAACSSYNTSWQTVAAVSVSRHYDDSRARSTIGSKPRRLRCRSDYEGCWRQWSERKNGSAEIRLTWELSVLLACFLSHSVFCVNIHVFLCYL